MNSWCAVMRQHIWPLLVPSLLNPVLRVPYLDRYAPVWFHAFHTCRMWTCFYVQPSFHFKCPLVCFRACPYFQWKHTCTCFREHHCTCLREHSCACFHERLSSRWIFLCMFVVLSNIYILLIISLLCNFYNRWDCGGLGGGQQLEIAVANSECAVDFSAWKLIPTKNRSQQKITRALRRNNYSLRK